MRKIYVLIATILTAIFMLSSVNFVFATSADRELTNDEKAAFIVRDEWTAWVKSFTASLSELDKNATAKIYDDMDFYDMQYRFTEKYKKVPEYLDEDGKPTQKLKDMIKEKRKEISGAPKREFLCFTAKANGVSISLSNASLAGTNNLGKSSDGISFTIWDGSAVTLTNNGDKLYVWNKGNTLSTGTGNYAQFLITGGNVEVSGDAASMINFGEAKPYCFYKLFAGTGKNYLTSLPEVSLTNTANYCYYEMFDGCSNAKTGPSSLPAENIASHACQAMFRGCTQLETVPSISAKSVGELGCYDMFSACAAFKTAPNLPATTLSEECYSQMFIDCTGLTDAPATLPALTVPREAYFSMFAGCTNIVKSPMIKATTMANKSLEKMFAGCISLKEIHIEDYKGELGQPTVEWTDGGVPEDGTIYYPGPTTAHSTSEIPIGWTKVS